MLALRGNRPLPTIENLESFLFAGGDEEVSNFVGQLPTTRASANGKGFLGLYGGPHDFPGKRYRDLVYDTGIALARTVTSSQEALSQGPYIAENGADYDFGNFGEQLQRVAMLLKRTPVRVLGINLQGWDTHVNQGAVLGAQPKLLSDLAQGLRALFLDLQEQWDDLLIVTLTEFGRTTLENASGGTDHGKACNLFVAGGAVRGGVYNCDASTWAPGDALGDNRRYLLHRTDFRAIFAEIFTRHFGDDPALLDRIIPGYSEAVAATPGEFEPLGFLPA